MNPLKILCVSIGLLAFQAASAAERMLVKEVTVRSTLDEVWNAWTTAEGLAFVSAESNVELRRGGPYEWFLELPADQSGNRGAEGSRILAYLPKEMIAFSWTFPRSIPALRYANETTLVVVNFEDLADGDIRVRLTALEWQEGEAWDAGWAYFDDAWERVLQSLKNELEGGSID